MEKVTRKTATKNTQSEIYSARRVAGVIFGVIEIILLLRFLFKLLGANASNGFVNVLYKSTHWLVGIFEGIFPRAAGSRIVFDPATLITMAVVGIIAYIVLKLLAPKTGTRVENSEYIESDDIE